MSAPSRINQFAENFESKSVHAFGISHGTNSADVHSSRRKGTSYTTGQDDDVGWWPRVKPMCVMCCQQHEAGLISAPVVTGCTPSNNRLGSCPTGTSSLWHQPHTAGAAQSVPSSISKSYFSILSSKRVINLKSCSCTGKAIASCMVSNLLNLDRARSFPTQPLPAASAVLSACQQQDLTCSSDHLHSS